MISDGTNGDDACKSYEYYERDVELLKNIGVGDVGHLKPFFYFHENSNCISLPIGEPLPFFNFMVSSNS